MNPNNLKLNVILFVSCEHFKPDGMPVIPDIIRPQTKQELLDYMRKKAEIIATEMELTDEFC